jgi:serine/threonine protein kinase
MASPSLAVTVAQDADGHPVWGHREGQPLVPGSYAWQRLGVGRRCETWLAWSVEGWHPVVVKLPRPHQVTEPRAWASLAREVYVLTRARHPALPRLYADRLDQECPHLVMEFVDGPDLAEELDDGGPLDAGSAVQLAATVLAALVAVHATGAAHCDIKPANVVLRDGRPVLIDFGSARPIGSEQPAGRPVGTLGYAAPEMEACRPITPAMDVYGVGVVLAEALSTVEARPPAAAGRLRVVPDDDHQAGPGADGGSLDADLRRLARQLSDPDPARRPDVVTALGLLAGVAGPDRLWPSWVLPEDLRRAGD